ncbi:MAG TPA: flagellar assembly protein FliX [Pseudolabrys sp.]|nr:flagellar assembly protein FliX [Pseudolabrys sp.]
MRIYGPNGTALTAQAPATRRAATGGFSVSEEDSPSQAASAGGLRSVSSLDALIALQGVGDATERRKRALARGRRALDELDKLKLSLIDGSTDRSTLARLKVAADGLTDESGDPGLDQVLSEIDLRVAVELAKAGMA